MRASTAPGGAASIRPMADAVVGFRPCRSLDLGCSECGDVYRLASRRLSSRPGWAPPEHAAHHRFLSAYEEADTLALGPADWEELRFEDVEGEAPGPEGTPASLTDGLVVLQRC